MSEAWKYVRNGTVGSEKAALLNVILRAAAMKAKADGLFDEEIEPKL